MKTHENTQTNTSQPTENPTTTTKKLQLARQLALQVDNINPNYPTLGAGYLANMKSLAAQILAL